ncbi:MAG: zinc-binding dehydrogenase [Thermodesulfobacteriota bacterium]|jgi:NADPH:quinone reductase-like Zn-dependent oxidoreductase
MKAVRIHEYGGTEVLRFEDAPDPKAGVGEVVVKVKACALNHLDLWVRQGLPKAPALPHILGSDIAGEVAEVGPGVLEIQVGTPVLLQPAVSCGVCHACLAGRDNVCKDYGVIGAKTLGGNAEYVTVPRANLMPLPQGLSYTEAAAIPLVFLTAWHMLTDRAQLRPGEDLLVIGASSGVGSAAIQVGKLLGARVIATASLDANLAKAKTLGADDTINHARQDIAEEVRKLTEKKGVEVVFEHVGPAVWDKCIAAMAKTGRLVTCGATTGSTVPLNLTLLFGRQHSLLGSFMGTKSDLLEVLPFFGQKKLKPVVDSVFPLKDIVAAHQRLESRGQFGKVVVVPE